MVPSPIQTHQGRCLEVGIATEYSEVRSAMDAVVAFLRENHLSEDEIMSCELAVAEGCNNAIRYSSRTAASMRIQLRAQCSTTHVMFWVHDQTGGFEWPQEVTLPPEECESGRGLYLMTTLMDSVHYYRGRGQNILYLEKRRGAIAVPTVEADPENPVEMRRRLAENDQIITDMAEELSFCYESLAAIFRHSADQGKGTTKAEFSRRLLNDLIQIIAADWYVLRLLPENGNTLNHVVASEFLFDDKPLPLNEEGEFHPIEQEAVVTRQNVWFDQSRPLDSRDPLGRVKPGASGVVHPFFFGDRLMGTLVLGRNLSRVPFTAGQLNVVGTFSDFLAIQFVNAEIQESLIESRITERELEIARNIQRSLLLQELPEVPGMSLVSHYESARQVGGDFYDVLKCGEDEVLLVIADVMGKGVPAAMFAAIMRSLVRALPRTGRSPGQLLAQANQLLYDELSSVDMFITAQLVLVNHRERTATVGSAGHCPALITTGDGAKVWSLTPDGLPLGVLDNIEYDDVQVDLEPGSRLMIYTDGVAEARRADGEQFDFWRLEKWIQSSAVAGKSAQEMKKDIIQKLFQFQGDELFQDDLTFLLLAG